MAPVFGYKQIPVFLTPAIANLCLRLPNFFEWWEPTLKSANDASVHHIPITPIVQNWRKHGANIRTYEFEAELQLGHDFIDPAQRNAQTDLVYPRLIELITQ